MGPDSRHRRQETREELSMYNVIIIVAIVVLAVIFIMQKKKAK